MGGYCCFFVVFRWMLEINGGLDGRRDNLVVFGWMLLDPGGLRVDAGVSWCSLVDVVSLWWFVGGFCRFLVVSGLSLLFVSGLWWMLLVLGGL